MVLGGQRILDNGQGHLSKGVEPRSLVVEDSYIQIENVKERKKRGFYHCFDVLAQTIRVKQLRYNGQIPYNGYAYHAISYY